jgi:hypothetical protein
VPTSPPAVCAGHHSFALDVARMAQKQTYYRFVRHGRPKNGPRNWSMTVPALILTLLLNVLYVQDEDGFSEPPMIAGLGSLGCANGSLCVSASFISHEVGGTCVERECIRNLHNLCSDCR